MVWNNRNLLSRSTGGQKSAVKLSAGLAFSESCEGEICIPLSASASSMCLYIVFLLFMSVTGSKFLLFYMASSHTGLGAIPTPV